MLGDGTYGEVFMAKYARGPKKGGLLVAKRAKDGVQGRCCVRDSAFTRAGCIAVKDAMMRSPASLPAALIVSWLV
jgi:hypothetical protein